MGISLLINEENKERMRRIKRERGIENKNYIIF